MSRAFFWIDFMEQTLTFPRSPPSVHQCASSYPRLISTLHASAMASRDPWSSVDDIEGTAHYDTLGLSPSATAAHIKTAYRRLARDHHPDKGGSDAAFARLQKAYEVSAAHGR